MLFVVLNPTGFSPGRWGQGKFSSSFGRGFFIIRIYESIDLIILVKIKSTGILVWKGEVMTNTEDLSDPYFSKKGGN